MSRSVKAELPIQCEPSMVIDAFTSQQHLNGWWGVGKSLVDRLPGGLYALEWLNEQGAIAFVTTGILGYYEPGRHLRVENLVYMNPERPILGPMGLEVTAEPDGAATLATIVQSGYQSGEHWDWYYEAVRDAWPQALEILKNYLESL